ASLSSRRDSGVSSSPPLRCAPIFTISRAEQLRRRFTGYIAPISGIAGRAEVTAGNLVTSGQTLLTTLVSVDPIYVSFDGDEQAYLKYLEPGRSPNANAK